MSITLLTFFLLEAIVCTVLGQQLNKNVGESLVFTPNKTDVPAKINSFIWKNGKDKVAEWDKDFDLEIYGIYKGRTELDQTTGVLTINNLSIKDSGVYSVEINSKVLKTAFTVSIFKAVPNPQITYSCNSDKTLCTLTCDGDTTDAGTVSYHWKKGQGDFQESTKQLNVTKTEVSKISYTCQLKNAVSSATGVFDEDIFGPGQQLNKKAGESLVLTPNKVPTNIKSIIWKNGKDKVAERDKDFGLEIYGIYKDRTELDQTTGVLTINNLSIKDSGVYSVEINSKLFEATFTVSVFKAVPNPQITYSCNSDKTLCTLSCDGDTTDAEPVSYQWKKGQGDFQQSAKQLNVTKTEDSKTNYTCQLKNAVSSATGIFDEDIFGPDGWWTNAWLIWFSLLILAIVIVVLLHRVITGVWFYQKDSDGLNGVSYSVARSADNVPASIGSKITELSGEKLVAAEEARTATIEILKDALEKRFYGFPVSFSYTCTEPVDSYKFSCIPTEKILRDLLEKMEKIVFREDSDPEHINVFAYVYPEDYNNVVYLCEEFWSAPDDLCRDSKPGTLIHEVSHLLGTDDITYELLEVELFELHGTLLGKLDYIQDKDEVEKLHCVEEVAQINANSLEYEFETFINHEKSYEDGRYTCCEETKKNSVCGERETGHYHLHERFDSKRKEMKERLQNPIQPPDANRQLKQCVPPVPVPVPGKTL
ncbi:hypothetical protein UPYG_G00061290 [Umbra pygmaea]|uniref:Ig-like domain-containing protein n=1 Tax=Umbra pygmaea TaxID=75934 RepID=A0ABD0X9G0_UMBPY